MTAFVQAVLKLCYLNKVVIVAHFWKFKVITGLLKIYLLQRQTTMWWCCFLTMWFPMTCDESGPMIRQMQACIVVYMQM